MRLRIDEVHIAMFYLLIRKKKKRSYVVVKALSHETQDSFLDLSFGVFRGVCLLQLSSVIMVSLFLGLVLV